MRAQSGAKTPRDYEINPDYSIQICIYREFLDCLSILYLEIRKEGKIMNLLQALKQIFIKQSENNSRQVIKRKQYNLTIDQNICHGIKFLSADIGVPQFVLAEHVLQIGASIILQDLQNPEKKNNLINHLVNEHLLKNNIKKDIKL